VLYEEGRWLWNRLPCLERRVEPEARVSLGFEPPRDVNVLGRDRSRSEGERSRPASNLCAGGMLATEDVLEIDLVLIGARTCLDEAR
jgi:hypothetical protein